MPTERPKLTEESWLHYRLTHTPSAFIEWFRELAGKPKPTKEEIINLNREDDGEK